MLRQTTTITRTKNTKKNLSIAAIANDKVSIMKNKINHDENDSDKNNNQVNSVDNNSNLLKLLTTGFLVGLAAGYFGIGGGFIIVPSLMHLGLSIIDAIGTSLIPVNLFGFSTAIRYSFSNQIEWVIALLFIVGWRNAWNKTCFKIT